MQVNSTTDTSALDINAWIAQLKKNAPSTEEQLLDIVNDSAKEIKADKTTETKDDKAKETDEIQDVSTITKEDLESPIDLKL